MNSSLDPVRKRFVRLHLMLGFSALTLFIILGVVLESLHALKAPLYLDAENETRRLMWRLAHAHGTLIALLQLGVSWLFAQLGESSFEKAAPLISRCFNASLLLLPTGFFLGGATAVDGDPGLGILLVPMGAVFLFAGALLSVLEIRKL
jgi:hypothetical protein